ncbi:hypothetical protein EYF80_064925 [Liparis tanakae]|uniref:Uncharacterized protein n=1 Tax=Liparis tanakae TaxID=230148 RepID=A0A4Z2E806_9TELE|nr:hypothetical protein EYF80_064925 [Liparis tanakae]
MERLQRSRLRGPRSGSRGHGVTGSRGHGVTALSARGPLENASQSGSYAGAPLCSRRPVQRHATTLWKSV